MFFIVQILKPFIECNFTNYRHILISLTLSIPAEAASLSKEFRCSINKRIKMIKVRILELNNRISIKLVTRTKL